MCIFPDYFPDNFSDHVRKAGGKEQRLHVYRLAKQGKLNDEAFFCTKKEDEILKVDRIYNDPLSDYCTSCFLDFAECDKLRKFFMRKHYPRVIMLCGHTCPLCGPSQITKERTKENTSHVDWWIYKDATPCICFYEVKSNEEV